MKVEDFLNIVGADFYTGVPDSQLKPLCDCLMDIYGIDVRHHIIAANEGNCVALAAGYHLATGRVPVVYLQNSGEGNIINPLASLLNEMVYAIPMIFVVGWRGEPGTQDEPQHIYQGKITLKLLEVMGVEYFVIDEKVSAEEVKTTMEHFRIRLKNGRNAAFVIRKGALSYGRKVKYQNAYDISREEIIQHIVQASGEDPVISTTGKASRELFEIRERNGQVHGSDFLTVGSMGHSSSIALGVALNCPNRKIWCIDGDGAVLMHMGAMPVIGNCHPENLVHIVINNGAHETVGGMPTVAESINLAAIAEACGYPYAVSVESLEELDKELNVVREYRGLCFVEVKCGIGARNDLGRPTTDPLENKSAFMKYLRE